MNCSKYLIVYIDKPFNDVQRLFQSTRANIEVQYKVRIIITISHHDETITNIEIIAKDEKNIIQSFVHIVNMYPELFPFPLSRNIIKSSHLQNYKESHKLNYIYFT